jgi:hypothetical protein
MDPIVYGTEPTEATVASGRPWQRHPLRGLAPPIPLVAVCACAMTDFEVLEGMP